MQEIIVELERVLGALRSEQEQRKEEARKRALEASERLTQETAEWLLDSGVFDALSDEE